MAKEHTGAWSASGQAELENRIVLLRVELEYVRGGGPRRGYYVHYVFYSYVVVLPPPPPPPQIVAKFCVRQEDRQAGRRQSGDRRTDRQATDRQATSVSCENVCREFSQKKKNLTFLRNKISKKVKEQKDFSTLFFRKKRP